MKAMNSKVDCCAFSDFHNFFFYLLAGFLDDFFNTGRVYPSVGHELMKRQACNLTSDGIKAGQHNGLRGIIYNYLNPCSCLESPDIPALPANDAALDLVRVNVENCHRIFNGCLGSYPLNGHHNYTLGLFGGSHLSVVKDLIDV